jgi:hypothetical protein
MEETKTVNAEIKNKEDGMGLTTQNQDEIIIEEGTAEPGIDENPIRSEPVWNKAKKRAAKAGHKDDEEYIESVYVGLMAENEKINKENPKEPDAAVETDVNDPSTANWKRARKRAAKEGHKGDSDYIAAIYKELEALDEDKSLKEPTKDEEINAVGMDVPTVERPKAELKLKARTIKMPPVERAAIIFLAKTLLTSTDLEDFKTLYPSLF